MADSFTVKISPLPNYCRYASEDHFKWRVFNRTECALNGPNLKFIEDDNKEFCNIGDVYIELFPSDS